MDGNWTKEQKSSTFSFSTSSPSNLGEYEVQIVLADAALTNEVYLKATNELTLIQTELTDAFLSTEIVAKNMLKSNSIIQSIDNGPNVISFGSISVIKFSPKVPLKLALSVFLGGMVSVFFILGRNVIAKRKEQLANLKKPFNRLFANALILLIFNNYLRR